MEPGTGKKVPGFCPLHPAFPLLLPFSAFPFVILLSEFSKKRGMMIPRHNPAGGKKVWGLILILAWLLFVPSAEAENVQLIWDPAKVTPGSVVPIRVASPEKLLSCEAVVGTDRFPLFRKREGHFIALVGVELGIKESVIPVDLEIYPLEEEKPYRLRMDLKVRKSEEEAKVQNLSLPTGMVDFSSEQLQQISRDGQDLRESQAARTQERFWEKGFLVPVEGRITTGFGVRRVLNGQERSPHMGVDIAANRGTPIRASNSGKVFLAKDLYLSGKTVVVDHGWGISTLYGHLERISVSEGEEVERGQILGTVGTTGRSTGPHLHFGAYVRGVKVDPLKLVEATGDFGNTREPQVE